MGITIITSLLSYYVCAVIEVNVDMGNVTVPESDPTVEICFSLSSGISELVVVTSGVGRGGAQGARAPPSALGLVMPNSHSP